MKTGKYTVLGIMSGTSLDGVDLALCRFEFVEKWNLKLLSTSTIPYTDDWKTKLSEAHLLNAEEFLKLDRAYGTFLGELAKKFLGKVKVHFIASHGHTIFHQPDQQLTFQLGHGASLAAASGFMVINDFRSMDVALGGQGAPLVPIGDELLFPDYTYCLNLGGFANISYKSENQRIAYDICPVNFVLNRLCPPFDKDGNEGRKGQTDPTLLEKLNQLTYYQKPFPKSLGREWVEKEFFPLLFHSKLNSDDILRTVYEHIAVQVSSNIQHDGKAKLLITGGGALNKFLIELITSKTVASVFIPEEKIVQYKEALIFAFLGVLRVRNEINCLSSVTGARKDSCTGTIWI